jgi:hypothetical protein
MTPGTATFLAWSAVPFTLSHSLQPCGQIEQQPFSDLDSLGRRLPKWQQMASSRLGVLIGDPAKFALHDSPPTAKAPWNICIGPWYERLHFGCIPFCVSGQSWRPGRACPFAILDRCMGCGVAQIAEQDFCAIGHPTLSQNCCSALYYVQSSFTLFLYSFSLN